MKISKFLLKKNNIIVLTQIVICAELYSNKDVILKINLNRIHLFLVNCILILIKYIKYID